LSEEANETLCNSIVLPFNNVPMEIVSELLGHTKMATTQQSYGKIIQKRVGEEMRKISDNED
jgi:integrase